MSSGGVNVNNLTDDELVARLEERGADVGPITGKFSTYFKSEGAFVYSVLKTKPSGISRIPCSIGDVAPGRGRHKAAQVAFHQAKSLST